MTTTTHTAPFSGRVLPLDWKRMVGLVTLAPLRIALLTPLIILAWIGLFAAPKVYQQNQAQIDEVLGQVMAQVDEVKGKVLALIPNKAAVKKEE